MKKILTIAFASLFLFLAGCSDDDNDTSTGAGDPHVVDLSSQNIAEIAAGSADLTTLVSALSTAGLVDTLANDGPFTVFAPTNAAFAAIQSTVDSLSLADLTAVLNYHVLPGIRPFSDMPATSGAMPSLVGDPIRASNGTIFVIDQVLLP